MVGCPSVWLSRHLTAAAAGLLLSTVQAADIDWQQWRRSTALSSKCGQWQVDSRGDEAEHRLVTLQQTIRWHNRQCQISRNAVYCINAVRDCVLLFYQARAVNDRGRRCLKFIVFNHFVVMSDHFVLHPFSRLFGIMVVYYECKAVFCLFISQSFQSQWFTFGAWFEKYIAIMILPE